MNDEPTKEKYKVIGTKTSQEFYLTFKHICHHKKLKIYQAIQMMVDAFVRYTDDRHNLSENMERLMSIFEHMEGWKDAFNLADASADRQIDEAVYFLTAKDRKGARAILVHRPFLGNWTETVNVQRILERTIEVVMPERYRRLRALAIAEGCNSILDLLDHLIDEHSKDADLREMRQQFEDARADNGKALEYGAKTRSRQHRGVDMYETQTTIHFNDDDRQLSDEEVENSRQWLRDNSEYEPFGGEW